MLETTLQEIGLNEKEAKVYLAALELGQATAQQIAKKSGVNRATTYFILESLIDSGLASSFHKQKKQFFMASDPERLIKVIEQEKELVKKKEENFKKILPKLKFMHDVQSKQPIVKYYEGKKGIMTMYEELLDRTKPGDLAVAYSIDDINDIFSDEEIAKLREKRAKKNLKTRVIYAYKEGVWPDTKDGIRKKVPLDKFPLPADIAIYDRFVRIATSRGDLIGIVIESKEIADALRSVFNLAWEKAEEYNEKEIESNGSLK